MSATTSTTSPSLSATSASAGVSQATDEPWREFEDKYMLILDDNPRREYRRRNDDEKVAVPWGQRKLFLTEVSFFSRFWRPEEVPNPVVVYAGAAPGTHIPYLAELFPEMTFHLYDPRPFKLQVSRERCGQDILKRITTHVQLFTDEDAAKWADRNDVIFISDIRTADFRKMSQEDNEKAIVSDMRMQERWYNIIKPVTAHMKFRLPYPGRGQPDMMSYLDGHLLIQPWAPQTSTETRLVPTGPGCVREWDIVKYEQQLFHHNTVIRERYNFLNPLLPADTTTDTITDTTTDSSRQQPLNDQELLTDFDSTLEAIILRDYLMTLGQTDISVESVVALSTALTAHLNGRRPKNEWYTLAMFRRDPRLIKSQYALLE